MLLRNAALLGRASFRRQPAAPPRRHASSLAPNPPAAGEGFTANIAGCIDKAHESKSLAEIAKLPPGALQGLKEEKADALLATLGVRTIAQLGKWKHYRTARALSALGKREADGGRPADCRMNVNKAVDQAYETRTLREIVAAPPSALQGLTPADDDTLRALGVKTIDALGKWKYAVWAEAIVTLAQLESAEFESR
jgi:hypothetical protein